MTERLRWGNGAFDLEATWSDDMPAQWTRAAVGDREVELPAGLAMVDAVTVGAGRTPASDRLVHSAVAPDLRHVEHVEQQVGDTHRLTIVLEGAGLRLEQRLSAPSGVAAFRAEVEVTNIGEVPVVLRAVPSWSAYLGLVDGDAGASAWTLRTARSDWLGENRWYRTRLDAALFPDLVAGLTGWSPRGELRSVSTGTWSTGRALPVGTLESPAIAWGWQIEHNGPWRWEVGQDNAGAYLALSGPADDDHHWTEVLQPGERFRSVPVALALGSDSLAVTRELTRYRRAVRRAHPDNQAMPVVFNDYMNTLSGDPTTAKLLPLVDAAAQVGAEVFCIDAGWYDDGPWWDAVGEWRPAERRFPGGLSEVVDRIREAGMTPGLWLEPEVVGVRSPLAGALPPEAFLSRSGVRVVEHGRYHLDLSHPAAVAHLDGVVDRLVSDLGVGYFKLDYNIDPGSGSDLGAVSPGAGLLRHNRAHLAWIDAVLDRHPHLVLENCGSGGMRADPAMLSRFQLQSTSDQQNFLHYPPIAASAPASMLPEQAASWAYPQPGMVPEEVAFCLVTGLLGRFFVSGHLNRMAEPELQLVGEAVRLAKRLRAHIAGSLPRWPLDLPAWDAPWVSLALDSPERTLVAVWCRDPGSTTTLRGLPAGTVRTLFPTTLQEWRSEWVEDGLRVTSTTESVGARLLAIEPASRG